MEREERKLVMLQGIDAIREGVLSMMFEVKMHEEFDAQAEEFKNGFEMALAIVHDAIRDVMIEVTQL